MKTALIIGSTGMIGTELIKQLIENEEYTKIISLVRRESEVKHPKLTEHVVNFDAPEAWKSYLKGDVLFSVMGTTLKTAGSKENQYKVDYTYQYEAAKAASDNQVPVYVLLSSAGAKSSSANFYQKIKGKLEDDVKRLPFEVISIIQPGQLDGARQENRPWEKLALKVMYTLNRVGLLKKYRPIQAPQVARAMLNAANKKQSRVYTLEKVFELADAQA